MRKSLLAVCGVLCALAGCTDKYDEPTAPGFDVHVYVEKAAGGQLYVMCDHGYTIPDNVSTNLGNGTAHVNFLGETYFLVPYDSDTTNLHISVLGTGTKDIPKTKIA